MTQTNWQNLLQKLKGMNPEERHALAEKAAEARHKLDSGAALSKDERALLKALDTLERREWHAKLSKNAGKGKNPLIRRTVKLPKRLLR